MQHTGPGSGEQAEEVISTEKGAKQDLEFQGSDPGAVRYGNFINYYSFHPAESRVDLFPKDIWTAEPQPQQTPLCCLDVGCNSGELTLAMHSFLKKYVQPRTMAEQLRTLGIDIDPTLITRAQENCSLAGELEFLCLDIMNEAADVAVRERLSQWCVAAEISAVFLMSVTMWVHLMHGDTGLRMLLTRCATLTRRWLVLEQQPWSCYRAAQRRLVRSGQRGFDNFPNLSIKGDKLMPYVHEILTECGMKKLYETEPSQWKRTVLFYSKQ